MLNQGLRVMDSTAITFCMDNDLPIVVFDLTGDGNVRSLLEGERSERSSTEPRRGSLPRADGLASH